MNLLFIKNLQNIIAKLKFVKIIGVQGLKVWRIYM